MTDHTVSYCVQCTHNHMVHSLPSPNLVLIIWLSVLCLSVRFRYLSIKNCLRIKLLAFDIKSAPTKPQSVVHVGLSHTPILRVYDSKQYCAKISHGLHFNPKGQQTPSPTRKIHQNAVLPLLIGFHANLTLYSVTAWSLCSIVT